MVNALNEAFEGLGFDDLTAKRNLAEFRRGSFDVRIEAKQILPFAIEVKNEKTTALRKAFVQALQEAPEGFLPLGVSAESVGGRGKLWVASLALHDLAELLARAHGYRVLNDEDY